MKHLPQRLRVWSGQGCLGAVLVLCFVLASIFVAYAMPQRHSNDQLPWAGLQDRASAIAKLQSTDRTDRLEALVALRYKSHDLQEDEIAALLQFACRAESLHPLERDSATQVLKFASERSEPVIVERLARLFAEDENGSLADAKCLMHLLIEMDAGYADAVEYDVLGAIRSIDVEVLEQRQRVRANNR